MLILSRKPGDAILIDGGIRVVVLASDHGGVRLGIEAPASVGIVREEIAESLAKENVRAGTADSKPVLAAVIAIGLVALPGGSGTYFDRRRYTVRVGPG